MDFVSFGTEKTMGVAENIDALLVSRDMTQSRLAEIADVDRSTVSEWRTKGRRPRDYAISNLCEYFGITPDDILSEHYGLAAKLHGQFGVGVTASGEASVPLITLGRVHAGDMTDEEAVSVTVEVPAHVLEHHPKATAFVVEGDCMDRVAPEGMTVVLDPELRPANGSIVVAEIDYRAVMRRWYMGGDTLLLVADSHSEHEDIVVRRDEAQVSVLGVVVWVQSTEEMA